jgi:hypothetical protein
LVTVIQVAQILPISNEQLLASEEALHWSPMKYIHILRNLIGGRDTGGADPADLQRAASGGG